MKYHCPLRLCSLSVLLLTRPLIAQPPEPRKPPKPAVAPLSLAAANKAFGEPTRVTLHLKDVTPQDVVKELSEKSGVAMRVEMWNRAEGQKQLVTVDIDNQPFWMAVRDVCEVLKVAPEPYGARNSPLVLREDSGRWTLGTLIPLSPLVMLRLSQMSRTHTMILHGDATATGAAKAAVDTQDMVLQGVFLFDPKLRLIEDRMRIEIIEAVDDKGVTMVNANQRAYTYGQSSLMWMLQVPLIWRANMGTYLKRLRVSAKCFVTAKHEVWEVPDVLNARETSKTVRGPDGDETYTFLGLKKIGGQYQVHLKVARPPALAPPDVQQDGEPLFWMRRNFGRMVTLLDTKGRALRWQGNSGNQNDSVINFGEMLAGEFITADTKKEPPEKLVLDIPLEYRELEVPFELKDLPLP